MRRISYALFALNLLLIVFIFYQKTPLTFAATNGGGGSTGAQCYTQGGTCISWAHGSCQQAGMLQTNTSSPYVDCPTESSSAPTQDLCCTACPQGTTYQYDAADGIGTCVAKPTATPTQAPAGINSTTQCTSQGHVCIDTSTQGCTGSYVGYCSNSAVANCCDGSAYSFTPITPTPTNIQYAPTNTPTPTAVPGFPTATSIPPNVCSNPCYIVAGTNNSCYASTCLSNNPADCAYPMSSMCSQNYSACGVNPVDSSFCQVSSNYTVSTDLPSSDSCVASLPTTITISTTGFPDGKTLYLFWNPGNNQLVAMGHGTTPSFTSPFASAIPSSALTPGTYALDVFIDPTQAANGAIGGTYAQIPYTIDATCAGATPTDTPTIAPTSVPGNTPTDTPTIAPTSVPGTTPTDTPTITPTSVPGTTPTDTPTITPTSVPGTTPTDTPTITPTYAPNDTILSLTIGLTGIGAVGDQVNPNDSSLSNQNPVDTTRTLHVYAINNSGQVTYMDGTVNYDSSGDANNGYFTGTVDMGNLPSGNYQIMAKMDGYLRKAVPSLVQVSAQSTTNIPEITLVAGDINNDNSISILDYGLLMACITAYNVDGGPDAGCPQSQYTLSDLNDDGIVDLSDYNLWLRNSSVEYGD